MSILFIGNNAKAGMGGASNECVVFNSRCERYIIKAGKAGGVLIVQRDFVGVGRG